MKFFHVYNEKYFDGLVKNNLLNDDSGFKIQHCFAMPENEKFNVIAQPGGRLHNMLKNGDYAFYIDRIAGGITWHTYPYDKNLIKLYADLLGDWFLGFQLHESGSNRRNSDWNTIRKVMGHDGPYDLNEFKEKMIRPYAKMPDGTVLSKLSQDPPEVYAKMKYAHTYQQWLEEMTDMFRRRMADVDGHILPCDSAYQAVRIYDQLGIKTFMPEVGWQIPQMRQEVAITRGVAEGSKKTWGVYYETWMHRDDYTGYSMPCFNNEPGNEWYLTQELHPDDFTSHGANGGSSRLLQKRIYYYSLMAGAHYLSEEWGLNCSYSNMQTFTLSPYGEAKKEFIDFAHKIGRIRPVIPFAIVMPVRYSVLEVGKLLEARELGQPWNLYMSSPLNEEETNFFTHIHDVEKYIYERIEPLGNEGKTLTNSRFGDLFDIIYADAGQEVFSKYTALIDASYDSSFARSGNAGSIPVIESKDLKEMDRQIRKLSQEHLDCTVDSLLWLLSKDEIGNRYLSIFNNEGNERDLLCGDTILPEADRRVKVSFREKETPKIITSGTGKVILEKGENNDWYVTVPAADYVIIKV